MVSTMFMHSESIPIKSCDPPNKLKIRLNRCSSLKLKRTEIGWHDHLNCPDAKIQNPRWFRCSSPCIRQKPAKNCNASFQRALLPTTLMNFVLYLLYSKIPDVICIIKFLLELLSKFMKRTSSICLASRWLQMRGTLCQDRSLKRHISNVRLKRTNKAMWYQLSKKMLRGN